MFINNYINKRLNTVYKDNSDPLNKYRAEFLIYSLIASLFILFYTLSDFYFASLDLLFYRSAGTIIFEFFLLWILLYTNKLQLVAHAVCILLSILIITNFFVFINPVSIISMQFVLLLILLSYYLLGTKWGAFYSILCSGFLSMFFLFYNKVSIITTEIESEHYLTFIIIFVYNSLLIMYLQYHFFNAFNRTIKELKVKQEDEKLLNEKLKVAVFAAEHLAEAKTNFLSNISHELRTPLNSVIGMSNILLMDNPRMEQIENLDILKFSANNLLSLINNVLDINKIDSGNLEIENIPFKIGDLVQHIYRSFKIKATNKKLNFKLDINEELLELYLIGDPTRLTQIMTNLIENAIKFTLEGNVIISIDVIDSTTENIKILFSVSDTGIGIPKEKHETIFNSFSQASTTTTRNFGGTGLGLTIIKNLLALHQSEIKIESELNFGTTFSFEINFEIFYNLTIDNLQDRSKKINDFDISSLKILIAEDNQINVLLMQKLLAKWNIIPDIVANGLDAVKAFKLLNYNLILMDINMPIMDGYEASTIIRNYSDSVKATIPIIALTASVENDVKNKMAEVGINDFVSKPFNPEILRSKLESIAKSIN